MSAEEIVRALAQASPNAHSVIDDGEFAEDYHECTLCEASVPVNPEDHKVDCPWRMAVEWKVLHG